MLPHLSCLTEVCLTCLVFSVLACAAICMQVFIILEASDGLQAALSTHMTALYTQLASLPSTRMQLLTSATPHKTQALALQLCAAALQNTGFVRLSTPGTRPCTALHSQSRHP